MNENRKELINHLISLRKNAEELPEAVLYLEGYISEFFEHDRVKAFLVDMLDELEQITKLVQKEKDYIFWTKEEHKMLDSESND